jgi:hypothetical protein
LTNQLSQLIGANQLANHKLIWLRVQLIWLALLVQLVQLVGTLIGTMPDGEHHLSLVEPPNGHKEGGWIGRLEKPYGSTDLFEDFDQV